MREIRFRGKREDSGEWVYGGFYHGIMSETDNPFSLDNARIKTIILQEGTYYHVTSETVGQYTGLLDKNGTKIFEGDIVKWGHLANSREKPIRIAVVEFNPDIQYRTVTMGDTYFKQGCFAYAETQFYLEVIGNIHENPELLEVEK